MLPLFTLGTVIRVTLAGIAYPDSPYGKPHKIVGFRFVSDVDETDDGASELTYVNGVEYQLRCIDDLSEYGWVPEREIRDAGYPCALGAARPVECPS